jgi:hypothetical protein
MPKPGADAPVTKLETMSRAELEAYVSRNLKYLSDSPSPERLTKEDTPAKVDESLE